MNDSARLFTRVVVPHLADAGSLARGLTGSAVDAQDVVQEASLRALRGIHGYGRGDARAWVLTIVRHAAYDWMRVQRSGRLVFVEDLEAAEGLPPPLDEDTPETTLLQTEDTRRLEAAILQLPPWLREALLLREVHHLTYREIALRTAMPIGTVMSRLHRARKLVAKMLRDEAT